MGIAEIAQLSLGSTKAERELEDVGKYFISTPTYISATNESRRKTYYIGQRGAGKTALFNKLADNYRQKRNYSILKITPEDFSYEKFADAEHSYADIRSVYGTVWHYTLINHMFKGVIDFYDQQRNIKTNRGNIETLKHYLESKNISPDTGFLGTFLSYFGEFTSNNEFNQVLKVGGRGHKDNKYFSKLTSLSEISKEVNAFLNITDSYPVCLFIDELDTGWDNSKEATNFIHGLFYAVREVKTLRNVNVFVSLRSDMYNDLSSILPDPEKMREEIERFSWNPKTLRGLIAKRIIANYPLPEETPYDDAIKNVFDDGVLDYIIEHSLQRPREIIEFCSTVLNKFSNQISVDRTIDKPNMDTVKSVEHDVSRNRLDDMCREYEHQYPGLHFFLSFFENKQVAYSMDNFKIRLEDAMLRSIDSLGANSWLGECFSAAKPAAKLIEILFEIGFIKLYSAKDDKHLAYYEGSFLNFESVPRVKIHDVFVSALKCE